MVAVINSQTKGIAGLRKEYGEEFTIELVMYAIIDLCESLNVGKGMNEGQIIEAARLIQQEYYMLKPADLKLCFDMAKLGKFGEVYNRIDIQVISTWIDKYLQLRLEEAERMSKKEHESYRALESGQTDVSLIDKMKFYQNGLELQKELNEAAKKDKEERDALMRIQREKEIERYKQNMGITDAEIIEDNPN